MPSVQILAWGLLPSVAIVMWEAARRHRQRRLGFIGPVSAEGIRWSQYTTCAYQLGYAALALAYIDGAGVSLPLLLIVLMTCLTTGLLLWHLGERYGSWAPRLSDMRAQCYFSRLAVLRRARTLARTAYRSNGYERWSLRADITRSEEISRRAEQQLRRLQLALSTESFLRRISFPEAAAKEIRALEEQQRRVLAEAMDFLTRTSPLVSGQPDLALQYVRA